MSLALRAADAIYAVEREHDSIEMPVLEPAQIGRVEATVDFKLRIARPAGFNHALRIIKSNT